MSVAAIRRPTRVLVLGGGFGGVYVARRLERWMRRGVDLDVTIVNRDNFFLFTPMLHEVAASDIDLTHIVSPIRKLVARSHVVVGNIESIDLDTRRVVVSHAGGTHQHEHTADHIVLALGGVTNHFGLPGLAERSLSMKSLGDALALRNRMIAHLEEADYECAGAARARLLTVVVAGAGFAGVETAAAVHDFLEASLPHYPRLSKDEVRVILVEPGLEVLPELGAELGTYAARVLSRRGVEVRLGRAVSGVDDDGVTMDDGTVIDAGTVVWTAGLGAHPLVASLPCANERGRVPVDRELRVAGFPGLWALGDCAAVPDGHGGLYPPTAQHAIRQAKTLADNLAATARGQGQLAPFAFVTIGQLASLGRRRGVARILGWRFSGFLAWWLWRTIYLAKLPRLERKVRVLLDWTLDLFFSRDLVQLPPDRGAA